MSLKIKTKLTIVILAALIGSTLILGYSLILDRGIGEGLERKELELTKLISGVEDIAFSKIFSAHKMIKTALHYLYAKNPRQATKALAELESTVKAFKGYAEANDKNFSSAKIIIKDILLLNKDVHGFDNYADRYEALLDAIDNIKKDHNQFMEDAANILGAAYSNDVESYELLGKRVEERGEALYGSIRSLSRDIEGLVNDEFVYLTTSRSNRHRITNYMLAILLLFLILDKLFIRNSVFGPIESTIDRISKLSKGVSIPKAEVDRDDEIGELLASVNRIIDSDEKIKNQMFLMSKGDYKIDVELRSEGDSLGIAMKIMIESLMAISLVADRIASGDYSEGVEVKGEHDHLGEAINQMLDSLRQLKKDNERQMWFLEGRAELSETVHGDIDVNTMSNGIVAYLARKLEAQIGTLYLMQENNKLLLTGSYALVEEDDKYSEVSLGQGIIGQAALDKEPMIVTDIPRDYLKVRSSIGELHPKNIIALPFIFEKRVKGVIELGTFREFTDDDVEFLKSIASRVAMVVNLAQSRGRMKELLEETQRQAEELESQQTRLEVTNAELEEKTYALEIQRDEIVHKTDDLETAQFNLQKQADNLLAASKYKTEFLANMSHELRTPLNSLLILAQDLKENKNNNLRAEQVQSAEFIYKSGHDLLRLINDILDLSKIEAGQVDLEVGEVSLADVATDVDTMFRHMTGDKGLKFKIEVEKKLPREIRTDKAKLEQIIRNLVSNAVKFTEKGGITVSFHRPAPDVDLFRSGLSHNEAIAVSVIDTGIGISPDKHKDIFEAFHQVDGSVSRRYGGTGLGLSISTKLSRLLGGELKLESVEGKGSTFTLYICQRLDLDNSGSRGAVSRPISEDEGKKEKISDDRGDVKEGDSLILIVDRDPLMSRKMIKLCRKKPFKCLYTDKGDEAMELTLKYLPSAIILGDDIVGNNGVPLIQLLKGNINTRHIPVHLISSENKVVNDFSKCAIGYLMKPASREKIEKLLATVERHISKGIRRLLIVEDDGDLRMELVKLIGNGDVVVVDVGSGQEALERLKSEEFDCMILDLKLPDMYGIDLLKEIERLDSITRPYVIVNTGLDISREEEQELRKYASSIIVKTGLSNERLLDEAAMFLHRVVDKLPDRRKAVIKKIHNKDTVFKGKNILLVDDDMRNLFAISKILGDRGATVHEATNGKEAIDYLEKRPDMDLVLMDIMMPVMDGYEAIHYIRKQDRFQDLPILTLTAKAMKEDRYKSISVGANDYLSKPVDIEQLLSLMRVWLYN